MMKTVVPQKQIVS